MLGLNSVWASGASDVWAVGEAGVILHYNGVYFTPLTLAYVTNALRAVWGTSSSDSWAVGNLGSALRKSGSRWLGIAAADSLAADLNAITGRSSSDIWAGGAGGIVLQWNGTTFVTKSGPLSAGAFQDTVKGIATIGSGASDVIAVGSGGTIVQYAGSGTTWTRLVPASTNVYNGIWASTTTAWVVGNGGVIMRRQGTSFVADPLSGVLTPHNLAAIWGSSDSDVWAVGEGGTIVHYKDVPV